MEGKEDRRNIRWAVEERTAGRITAIYDASLINISVSGALIEHSDLVRPGTLSVLTFVVRGQEVGVRCRVVRSLVDRTEVQADGEHELVYRSALEFQALSEDSLWLIDEFIDSLRGQR